MRPRIEALDVDAMDWAPLGPAGLYSKLLSRDTETGARTALQRLCPVDGYEPPKVAHYHHTYEEILGVEGDFSFDSRLWVKPGTYVFHPPMTVHGFKSAIRAESLFLSRVGRDLDFNFVPEPAQTDLYTVEGASPPRTPVAMRDPVADKGWAAGAFLGDAAQICVLSTEPETGEGSALVKLPAGWASHTHSLLTYVEMFVMEGGIAVDGGATGPRHAYFFYPPADGISPLTTAGETLLYVNFGAPIGF